jgi:hypothetical protein
VSKFPDGVSTEVQFGEQDFTGAQTEAQIRLAGIGGLEFLPAEHAPSIRQWV